MLLGVLLLGLPFTIFISSVCYLPFYLSGCRHQIPKIKHLVHYLFTGCCIMILFATLLIGSSGFHPSRHLLNLTPFFFLKKTYHMGYNRMVKQLLLNILMFVPIGCLLPLVFSKLRRFWKTAGCCFLATLLIETIQYFTGRSADIDDVLMNTLGGILGYGLFLLAGQLFGETNWFQKLLS